MLCSDEKIRASIYSSGFAIIEMLGLLLVSKLYKKKSLMLIVKKLLTWDVVKNGINGVYNAKNGKNSNTKRKKIPRIINLKEIIVKFKYRKHPFLEMAR